MFEFFFVFICIFAAVSLTLGMFLWRDADMEVLERHEKWARDFESRMSERDRNALAALRARKDEERD